VARASCPCMAVLHSPTAAAGYGISPRLRSGQASRVGRGAYGVNRDSSRHPSDPSHPSPLPAHRRGES